MTKSGAIPTSTSSAAVTFSRQPTSPEAAHLRAGFVRRAVDDDQPLPVQLVLNGTSRGGRGGRTRLALLLTSLWTCAGGDHTTRRPASWWAEMIGHPEPSTRAATRSVQTGFRTLAARGFVTITPGHNGYISGITLLDELHRSRPYQRPYDTKERYLRIPATLWTTNGLIGRLSAPALSMYLVLLNYYDSREPSKSTFFTRAFVDKHHGLSEDTRLAGLSELAEQGVVLVREEWTTVQFADGARSVQRRYYRLTPSFRPPVDSAVKNES